MISQTCRRLPVDATRAQKTEAHETKMEAKKRRRGIDRERLLKRRGKVHIYANLSAFHPDFGTSPAKHSELKAARAAGRIPFVPRTQLEARRRGILGRMGL